MKNLLSDIHSRFFSLFTLLSASLIFFFCLTKPFVVFAQKLSPFQIGVPHSVDPCQPQHPRPNMTCTFEPRKPYSNPLLEAIDIGDLEQVKKLIAAGADVNFNDERNATPLSLATGYQDLEMVSLLIGAGANVNLPSGGHETVLMTAARGRCTKITEYLLSRGALVNPKSDYQYTALFNAADSNNTETVRMLIAADADLYAGESSTGERSPLITAVRHNNIEIVKFILAADKEGRLAPSYETALWSAASTAGSEMVKLFISKGTNLNPQTRSGTALTAAAMRGDSEIVKILLTAGADPNMRGTETAAPLTWAATEGNTEVVKLLLAAGADINVREDWSPLVSAARNERIETMEVLLQAGADINQKARDGRTALMYAVSEGKIKSVKYLLEKGAAPNIVSIVPVSGGYTRKTALSLALEGSFADEQIKNEIVNLLKAAGAVE